MELNIYILLGAIFIAIVTEVIVNALKFVVPENCNLPMSKILALAVGIVIAVLANIDLFEAFGYPLMFPYVGSAFTGVVISLGAKTIYDIYEGMKEYRNMLAQEKNIE